DSDVGPGADAAASIAAIWGVIEYEDKPFDVGGFTGEPLTRPARGVLLRVLDEAGAVLGEGRTQLDGTFSIAHALPPEALIRVQAFAEAGLGDHSVRVTDSGRSRSVHRIESAPIRVADAADLRLLAEADRGVGGAFNVADVAFGAFERYAAFVDPAAPTLFVEWEPGLAFPCGSCYSANVISLGGQLDDTDEYDDVIILHELAHYFVEHYSRDTSPGGSHRDRRVEPTLAYGEGVAYFLACLLHGSPLIIDTYLSDTRVIDIEAMTQALMTRADFFDTQTGQLDGALREEIVAGILWDAFDAADPAEPFDRVELGLDEQLRLLIEYFGTWPHPDQGAPGIDLADYLYALECFSGIPPADVQALADDRAFPWIAGLGCAL
ncbi:MAG: hypothetical protein OEY14_11595, partial [Myxococcales bacterium]|nr:hypothetical protein [Myxococcales bacterium]